MAIRVTGLNSGMDTDAMVKELVSAYDTKTKQLEKQKTKMEWTQEAWKSINTKIYFGGKFDEENRIPFPGAGHDADPVCLPDRMHRPCV